MPNVRNTPHWKPVFGLLNGGLDLAVNAFYGAETAWHVEYDAAPSKILAHHWPDIPNYGDVTTIDWAAVEPVDILTGGYPCQPFSAAGRRQGTNDERHLWPYVRDAIRHLRPRYTVLENVAGHRSLGFDRVLGDLAEDGLHAWWVSIRASDVGAPHHRERVFILITPADASGMQPERRRDARDLAGTPGTGEGGREERQRDGYAAANRGAVASDANSRKRDRDEPTTGWCALERTTSTRGGTGVPADSESERLPGQQQPQRSPAQGPSTDSSIGVLPRPDWGTYGPAIRRWERLTRLAPAPTELNGNGKPRLNARFAEWMMGLPAGHVTAVPGLSRAEQLKAIGNGVCPPQAYRALEILHTIATRKAS